MKKLMIAVAIVCAAVMSQASNVNWSITGSTPHGSKAYYVFNASDRDAIVAMFAETASGTAAEILANEAFTKKVVASGQLTSGKTGAGTITGLAADGAVSYFTLVLNKNTASAGAATKYYLSGDTAGYAYTPGETDGKAETVAMSVAATVYNIAKTPEDVPEPTSAMLLLLGVAGLALKRKVA